MFLVEDWINDSLYLVFTIEDPRNDKCWNNKGKNIIDDVNLDDDFLENSIWRNGSDSPGQCVGRAKDNPKNYKVFRNKKELQSEGYEIIGVRAFSYDTWEEWIKDRLEHLGGKE